MTTEAVTHVPSPPEASDLYQKHDQLFKQLLQAFPPELVQLFVPNIAAKTRPESRSLNQEKFMNLGQKSFRRLDLLHEHRYRDDTDALPRKLLVSAEIEHRFDKSDAARWKHYLSLIYSSEQKAALMLVIYLNGGEAGLQKIKNVDSEDDEDLLQFSWWQYGLSGLSAEDHIDDPNLLKALLSVNMSRRTISKAELLARCLLRIREAPLTEYQQRVATVFVCSYLRLDKNEKEEYNRIILQPKYKGADNMLLTWDEEVRAEGMAKGKAEGKAEGILLTLRMRNIAASTEQLGRIRSCTTLATLDVWAERAYHIHHIDELWEGASGTGVPSQ